MAMAVLKTLWHLAGPVKRSNPQETNQHAKSWLNKRLNLQKWKVFHVKSVKDEINQGICR